jgi:hypothetical protein
VPGDTVIFRGTPKMDEKDYVTASESAEDRREKRFPCLNTRVMLRVTGSHELCEARVTEISRSGLRLWLPAAVAVGSSVQFDLGAMSIAGEIRYCSRSEGNSFVAGVSISDPATCKDTGTRGGSRLRTA